MSGYEKTHHVHCAESNEGVRSCIYDPNGNAMTYGELVAMLNELQDDCQTLKDVLGNIRDKPSPYAETKTNDRWTLAFIDGYESSLFAIQELARLGLSAVTGGGDG